MAGGGPQTGIPVKRTMPEAAGGAGKQLVQRPCTESARLLVNRASEQQQNGEAESSEERLQKEVKMLRHRLVDAESDRVEAKQQAERSKKGQEAAQQVARELQQRMEAAATKAKQGLREERNARADNVQLKRKVRELEEQVEAKSEEIVAVHLGRAERTRMLELQVADAKRDKTAAEAQAQRYLEEMRAAQGSADWQAKKEQLEADLANQVQRAANEQSRRMHMAQQLHEAKAGLAEWRKKYYEQKDSAEMHAREAALLLLRPDGEHSCQKLANNKFEEVFAKVCAAHESGRKEVERRKAAEELRLRREQLMAIELDVCRGLVLKDARYKQMPITCPIGFSLLEDPVSVADALGTTFERSKIEQFFARCEQEGRAPFNPSAGGQAELASTALTPNMTVRQIIDTILRTVQAEQDKLLASAAGKDTRSESYMKHTQFKQEIEQLRRTKIEQDKKRADEQERGTGLREQIRHERENAMRIDVDQDQQSIDENNMWAQQQIAQFNAELQDVEQRIDEMETRHKESYDKAIEDLVKTALELKEKMLDRACVEAAGPSSPALL